jgi:heme-degrading monooxygenase HmoA
MAMHARMVTVVVRDGKLEDVVRHALEVALPEAQRQPGFRGGSVLADAPARKVIGITYWESEEDLRASETSYLRSAMAKAISLFEEPTVINTFEVRLQV